MMRSRSLLVRARRGLILEVFAAGLGLVCGLCQAVSAQLETAPSAVVLDPASETRYGDMLKDLRCLVCQNESLADSDAPLAADLRNIVREQIAQGKTGPEIRRFLTDRYGDFVLYKPPFQANTWLLWTAPFLLILIGLLGAMGYFRRSKAVRVAPDPERLRHLLEDDR